jgi:hypothetical protein
MRTLGYGGVALLVILSFSPLHATMKKPTFGGALISKIGLSRLDLTDDISTIAMPPAFPGWECYIGDTQLSDDGSHYLKNITCGGKWGFVDGFVACGPKDRKANTVIRLRQPIAGTKEEWNAAEKLTISVGCSY